MKVINYDFENIGGLLQMIAITAFRNLLRKLGFCLEIGTMELRGILADVYKRQITM